MKMCENDEERNRKLKIEYQVFRYKKVYGTKFEVTIKEKGHLLSNLTCKTYDSYIETVNSGHLLSETLRPVIRPASLRQQAGYARSGTARRRTAERRLPRHWIRDLRDAAP